MSYKEMIDWLRIYRTQNIGPISFYHLFNRFKVAEYAIEFLKTKAKSVCNYDSIVSEIESTNRFGANLISFLDPNYPPLLRTLRDAPPFIIILGDTSILFKQTIAIVGSRNSSIHGNKISNSLAEGLTRCDFTIVSGLARGIDRYAHLGGIESTIAVVANGIDKVYPRENEDLYDKIKHRGLIISEAPFGTSPAPHLFHARNRIIAGLSIGTVVVEATMYSGSLITAGYAADYGRDIFAVPGCPLDLRAAGPNHLIKNGAFLVENYNDIVQHKYNNIEPKVQPDTSAKCDPVNGQDLLNLISTNAISIDELCANCDYSISSIRATLVELEIASLVRHLPGDKVVLA